ncbi:MAG: AAA domain-containing protein [Fermentimonas sp.]
MHSPGAFIDIIRVRLVSKDETHRLLLCEPTRTLPSETTKILHYEPTQTLPREPTETLPHEPTVPPVGLITVKYGVPSVNGVFNTSVERFKEGERINLVECRVDEEGYIVPSFFILEPDYLIDASAIAECFQDYFVSPIHYFRNKFEEMENRSYLLLGNLANYFLDELVFADDPNEVSFNTVFQQSFKQSPFEYASCEDIRRDNDFREFMRKAKQQFENIRRVIRDDFPRRGIDVHRCTLEPSFFSEKYGFQGRLDLLQPGASRSREATRERDFTGDPVFKEEKESAEGKAIPSEETAIVELKSGRLPFPSHDRRKLALNHEVQTAVYRLMMKSVIGNANEVDASILYSAGNRPGENLRVATEREQLEQLILNLRNQIVTNEKEVINGDNRAVESLFNTLFASIDGASRLPAFYINKVKAIKRRLDDCSELEKEYFYRYTRFVSRELYHQKIGDIDRETPTGVASLWNSDFEERVDALDVLFDLSIVAMDDSGNDMVILFAPSSATTKTTDETACEAGYERRRKGIPERTAGESTEVVTDSPTTALVNFRVGDICIVYPREDEHDTVLNRQVLKGSIVRITPSEVVVRFRYKQKNRRYFSENRLWAIEHDTLDSSTTIMYKGLFSFLGAPKQKKELLLGLTPPRTGGETKISPPLGDAIGKLAHPDSGKEGLPPTLPASDCGQIDEASHRSATPRPTTSVSDYPESIIRQTLDSPDYFLIVGPPGTGKTSIFARRLIESYYAQPGTNIMVLAYTNRAVDELCEAIHAALGHNNVGGNEQEVSEPQAESGESGTHRKCDAYIRVGSELGCAPPFRERLLQRIAERATNREELLHEIARTRIFVSTIASINGRLELFQLKHFHVAIIDEASQVLEPQIIGLLPRFDRFVMIGDHHQLATIVLQEAEDSKIEEPLVRETGILDCRDSMFERLMRQCIDNGWKRAYVQLTRQGRMHEEIAAFPATHFYPKGLSPANEWQSGKWALTAPSNHPLQELVARERTAFISTEKMLHSTPSTKINEAEAQLVANLLHALREVYLANGRPFNASSVGIIAPYRNQVALIRQKLFQSGFPEAEKVMVETVERFQGSQRDVILVSFCVNRAEQMHYLCAMNREGTVDRKLNVAITRARQQLFLVGNGAILREHPLYAHLLDHYRDRIFIPETS